MCQLVSAALLFVACGRSSLEPGGVDEATIAAGDTHLAGAGGQGAPRPEGHSASSGGVAGTGGASSSSEARSAGASSISTMDDAPPVECTGLSTWSCSPAELTGQCCAAEGSWQPKCDDVCVVEGDRHGERCDVPGESIAAPALAGSMAHCEHNMWGCFVRSCTCDCWESPVGAFPELSETCEPVLFSNVDTFPRGIALVDDFVYWTVGSIDNSEHGIVMGARRVDGSRAMAIPGLPDPVSVTAFDDELYWTNRDGSVRAANRDGSNMHVLAEGPSYPTTIGADADHVYWFADGIYRVARDGGGSPELFTAVENLVYGTVSAFVLDDEYVYFIDQGNFIEGEVRRAAKSGADAEILASATGPTEIAISSEGIFWVEQPSSVQFRIFMLGWGDDSPRLLAERSNQLLSLAAFADQVYWAESSNTIEDGFVYSLRAGESEAHLIADVQVGVGAIAVDEEYLFWVNQNLLELGGLNGQIYRTCR